MSNKPELEIADVEDQVSNRSIAAEGARPKFAAYIHRHWHISSQYLALLMGFLIFWGCVSSIFPGNVYGNSAIMRLIFLILGGDFFGKVLLFFGLPDILGMIGFGVFYRNVGAGEFEGLEKLESFLRDMALVNIMLLAGCGLDLVALKEHIGIITRLTLIPTIIEVGSITFLAKVLLDVPVIWGVVMGLVVTAISPNVVISVLLKLKEDGIGLYKGIHTIIIATTSFNDVISIFLFGVLCGVIFSTGNLSQKLIQGPAGIVLGVVFGTLFGLMTLFLPSDKAKYSKELRYLLLVLCGTLGVVGSKYVDYPSAGALACLCASTALAVGLRRRKAKDPDYDSDQVESHLNLMWKFLKPTSFSLVGKEVNFSVLTKELVFYGIVIILIAVGLRLLFGYVSFFSNNFTWKEKGYITISSFAKATVQAAIGPYALDLVRSQKNPDPTQLDLAQKVLVISVLSIILTAPLGAYLMTSLSTKWLKKERH